MVKLGMDAVLYRGAPGQTAETEVENVKDVTVNMETGEADVTTRKTNGWRAYASTLKEASVEFQINYDIEDEDFKAFQAAFFNNEPIALFVSDGDGNGLDADFSITSFSQEQPLEDAVKVSITAKPTSSGRAPTWKMAGA